MKQESGRNALLPTNEDTSGPYFPIYFRDDSLEDLTRIDAGVVAGASGEHIILRGRILDRHGDLAHGAIVELWQANAKGCITARLQPLAILTLIHGLVVTGGNAPQQGSIRSARSAQGPLETERPTSRSRFSLTG